MATILEYFEALERLKTNTSLHVPKGTKITNDAVALEAQRKKGSIKRGREVFVELIEAIQEAAEQQARPKLSDLARVAQASAKAENYQTLYQQSIARELMLLERIDQLEKELTSNKLPFDKKRHERLSTFDNNII